jgi:hypothetical protein
LAADIETFPVDLGEVRLSVRAPRKIGRSGISAALAPDTAPNITAAATTTPRISTLQSTPTCSDHRLLTLINRSRVRAIDTNLAKKRKNHVRTSQIKTARE